MNTALYMPPNIHNKYLSLSASFVAVLQLAGMENLMDFVRRICVWADVCVFDSTTSNLMTHFSLRMMSREKERNVMLFAHMVVVIFESFMSPSLLLMSPQNPWWNSSKPLANKCVLKNSEWNEKKCRMKFSWYIRVFLHLYLFQIDTLWISVSIQGAIRKSSFSRMLYYLLCYVYMCMCFFFIIQHHVIRVSPGNRLILSWHNEGKRASRIEQSAGMQVAVIWNLFDLYVWLFFLH